MPPSSSDEHDEKTVDRAVRLGAQVDLYAVGVDVVGLVVEPERRGVVGADDDLGLHDVHAEVERVLVPVGEQGRGELLGPGYGSSLRRYWSS